MRAMTKQDRVDARNKINRWNPKEKSVITKNQETVEEFLLRGGKIELCPPPKIDKIACSRKCCMSTFERLM